MSMPKTIAEAFSLNPKASAEDDVDDRRKDATSRAPTLGRRASPRRRVLLSALVVDLAKETIISCRVENVSETGARIKLAEPRFLPSTFWLIAITSGAAYNATVIWRVDERLGVELGEPVDLSDPADLVGRRLHKIWVARR
jgi:PilZ domain